MLEGAPDASGKTAIREALGGMMQDPNFALGFTTTDVVVAGSGDLAYETGRFALTMSDANNANAPVTQTGAYVVVWRKQPDGAWKVAVDAPISDPSAAQ
jgi:ketosteroid isomerase-like protein